MLDVRSWTLDVGRGIGRTSKRWTFKGWTLDVGPRTFEVACWTLGHSTLGRWTFDVWALYVRLFECSDVGRSDVGRWTLGTLGRWDVRRWTTDVRMFDG